MANGEPQPQMTSSGRRVAAKRRKDKLTAQDLLRYLSNPLTLPAFDVSRSTYKQAVVDTIQNLLRDAIETILPDKIVGVQFVFARRFKSDDRLPDEDVEADFSFPLLLYCSTRKYAMEISDGMAHVTEFLKGHHSSFHFRVRKFKLTYSPAICIFSTSPPPEEETDHEFDSTTVLWVSLPVSTTTTDDITFPERNLILKQRFRGRSFFQADLNPPIKLGLYDNDKEPSFEIDASPDRVQVIRVSRKTLDEKRAWLGRMQEDLAQDVSYLKRVSYLLKFGDVILCTPHAYDDIRSVTPDTLTSPHDTITDAGLTVIVERRGEPITEDDWLRVQVVAQKLAIFAGAAMSTAIEARGRILGTLHRGFEHEFGNAMESIVSRIEDLKNAGNPVTISDVRDIDGRLQFTQQYIESAVKKMYQADSHIVVKDLLNNLINPLMMYADVDVEMENKLSDDDKVDSLWHSVLIEVLRNAYKYGALNSFNKKALIISAESINNYAILSVTNQSTPEDMNNHRLSVYPKGWELIQEMSTFLKGSVEAKPNGQQVSIIIRMPLSLRTGALYA